MWQASHHGFVTVDDASINRSPVTRESCRTFSWPRYGLQCPPCDLKRATDTGHETGRIRHESCLTGQVGTGRGDHHKSTPHCASDASRRCHQILCICRTVSLACALADISDVGRQPPRVAVMLAYSSRPTAARHKLLPRHHRHRWLHGRDHVWTTGVTNSVASKQCGRACVISLNVLA